MTKKKAKKSPRKKVSKKILKKAKGAGWEFEGGAPIFIFNEPGGIVNNGPGTGGSEGSVGPMGGAGG